MIVYRHGGAELGRGGQGIVETMDDLATALRFANGGTKNVDQVVLVAVDLDDGRILRPIVKTNELSSWGDAVVFKRRLPGPFIPNDDDMTQEFENTISLGQKLAKGVQDGKLNQEDIFAIHQASSLLVLEVPTSTHSTHSTHPTQTVLVVGAQGNTNTDIYPFYRRLSGTMLHLEATFGIAHITGRHIMLAAKAVLRILTTLRKIDAHHGDIKEENIMWLAPRPINIKRRSSKSNSSSSKSSSQSSQDVQFALGDFGMGPHVSTRQSLSPFGTPGYQCPLMFPDTEDGRMKYCSYYPNSLPSFYFPVSVKVHPSKIAAANDMWESYTHVRVAKKLKEHDITEKNDLYSLGVTLARMIDSPVEIRVFATRLMTAQQKDALWHASEALEECRKILKERNEDLIRSHVYIPDSAASHENKLGFDAALSQRRRAAVPFKRTFSPGA